jgi:hypothetical protein
LESTVDSFVITLAHREAEARAVRPKEGCPMLGRVS